MNILSLTLAYLATGAVAGLLSGLFGIGFVSLPAFAGMAAGSLFLARTGARLSQRLSRSTLTQGFCVFLFVSAPRLVLPLLTSATAIQ